MLVDSQKIYEGKAKIIYASETPNHCLQFFKDSATAFNGEKKEVFEGKGSLNASISSKLFELLESQGVRTHFVRKIDDRTIETLQLKMIPVEVVVRNRVEGSLAKKFPQFAGKELSQALIEWYWKDDSQKDPQVSEDLLISLFNIDSKDLQFMKSVAIRVNEILQPYFEKINLKLVDFKLEFGKDSHGRILLADEISPDTCRLWDLKTGEKLDKDRFRFSLGDLLEGYREIWSRMK